MMSSPSQSRHNVQTLNLYVQRKEEVWIHYYVFISSSTEWHLLIIIILSSLKGNIVVIKLLMRILNLVDCEVRLITDWSCSHRPPVTYIVLNQMQKKFLEWAVGVMLNTILYSIHSLLCWIHNWWFCTHWCDTIKSDENISSHCKNQKYCFLKHPLIQNLYIIVLIKECRQWFMTADDVRYEFWAILFEHQPTYFYNIFI